MYLMKHIFVWLLVIPLLILINSCSHSKTSAASALNQALAGSGSEVLYQYVWKLVETNGKLIGTESKASLAFTPGQVNRVTGSTGCNKLNGTFELTGTDAIKFPPMATTRMACPGESAGVVESDFLAAVAKASNWKIEGDTLLLKSEDAVLLKFKGKKPPSAGEIALNDTWELNYISGAKIAFDGLFPNKKPTLIFDFPKPEASGNGGCNGYSAKVVVDGNKINLADPLSTMMACEGNGEPIYFKTLKTITSYNISDKNTLTLIMGDIAVMRFMRK